MGPSSGPSLTKPARQPPADIPAALAQHPPTLTALRGPLTSSCRLGMVPPSHPISLRFRVLFPMDHKLPVFDFRLRTSGRRLPVYPESVTAAAHQSAAEGGTHSGPPAERIAASSRGRPRPPSCPKPLSFIELRVGLFIYVKKSGRTFRGIRGHTRRAPSNPSSSTVLYRHLNNRTKHHCSVTAMELFFAHTQMTAANTNLPSPCQGENTGTQVHSHQEKPDFKNSDKTFK